ncbi:MAG: Unknown protein [uncultured Sulfurovum sp.]|uniref:SHSP domain-containing protein n=1 Tax=uncultured Sulfurovum sp. TaxID=269237 RepID=A0A6S6TA08_9BACT|nr:MAG: Unknown protein [uncultured Sulfurovum sp.]
MFIFLFLPLSVCSEIDMQKGIYDAAEEMMKFDEKMNKMIAEHNNIAYEGDENLAFSNVSIEDFKEVANGYELTRDINDSNLQLEVKVKDTLLIISLSSKEVKEIVTGSEIGAETIMTSSTVSLPIPNDADKSKLSSSYKDGKLLVKLPKK